MTTIAFRDGVLASDSYSFAGDMIWGRNTKKVFRLQNGCVCGGTGSRAVLMRYRDWLDGGEVGERPSLLSTVGDKTEESEVLVVRPGNIVEIHEFETSYRVEEEFTAIGSGEIAAMAAMHMGASATKAIEIATLLDAFSGGAVQHVLVGKPTTFTEITEHPIENIDAPTREWRDRYHLPSRTKMRQRNGESERTPQG